MNLLLSLNHLLLGKSAAMVWAALWKGLHELAWKRMLPNLDKPQSNRILSQYIDGTLVRSPEPEPPS